MPRNGAVVSFCQYSAMFPSCCVAVSVPAQSHSIQSTVIMKTTRTSSFPNEVTSLDGRRDARVPQSSCLSRTRKGTNANALWRDDEQARVIYAILSLPVPPCHTLPCSGNVCPENVAMSAVRLLFVGGHHTIPKQPIVVWDLWRRRRRRDG